MLKKPLSTNKLMCIIKHKNIVRKTEESRRKRGWKTPLLIILVVLFFPLAYDLIYRLGLFRWYPTCFSKDNWFSFSGSYFPAALLGSVTLYQSHIIYQKDLELRRISGFPKCIACGAYLFWKPGRECMPKEFPENDLYDDVWRTDFRDLVRDPQYGIYLAFDFRDINNNCIQEIWCERIRWNISENAFSCRYARSVRCILRQNGTGRWHVGTILDVREMKRENTEDYTFEMELKSLLNNHYRKNPKYITSKIEGTYKMLTVEGESYELEVCIDVRATQNVQYLESVYQSYRVKEGEDVYGRDNQKKYSQVSSAGADQ